MSRRPLRSYAKRRDVRVRANRGNRALRRTRFLNGQQSKARRIALADWVSALDFSRYQLQALEKHTPKTLEWVLQDSVFDAWVTNDNGGMLWGLGKPGAGKTILASFVIDYLQKRSDEDPTAVSAVCYVYCRRDTSLTALQIFESILKQLILCCPTVEIKDIQALKNQGRRPSVQDIISKLIDSTQPNMFIVIDALDECANEQCRGQVLEYLQRLTSFKVLVTSPHSPSRAMTGILTLHISARPEDVKTLFQTQIRLNHTLEQFVGELSHVDVEAKVIEKVDESFLLAELHIATLTAQTSMTRFLQAMHTFPTDPATIYEGMLQQIHQQEPKRRQLAFDTISWLLYALRPLKSIELRQALVIPKLQAKEDDLVDEELILSSCMGLITMNWVTSTMGFIHHTAQEFLLEIAPTSHDLLSELDVARRCLRVISSPSAPNHPLLRYSVSAWGPLVHRYEHDDLILGFAQSHLSNPTTLKILRDIEIDNELRFHSGDYTGHCGVNAVHLIAVYGLARTGIALEINSSSVPVNERDVTGATALIWAAKNGHSEVAQQLLTNPNIDMNIQDNFGKTALSWAAELGQLHIIRALLDPKSVDLNLVDQNGRTPKGCHAEVPTPPDTPTLPSRSRFQLGRVASTDRSTSQLPLGSPPSSPSRITPRNSSLIRPRSPSSRTRVVTPIRGLSSSSTSHLPISSNLSSSPRKPSIDFPRRPLIDSPRRSSIEAARRPSGGLAPRDEPPSPVRPRPRSPSQPSYFQNRHYNISSGSLISPPKPEYRELIQTATSMLCKEIIKPPPHMARTEAGLRDWEEVEIRTQALFRLERIWNKSGFSSSSTNLGSALSTSNSGEERERRLFCEALRDGYVLCQLMNKLRSSPVVKPDPHEYGFRHTSNVTKFLAACSSYGLPNEDLFHRDDLIEATGESLARVAKTIIALIKFVDAPIVDWSKIVPGQIKDVPKIMPPPPRSPLRNRAAPKANSQEESGNGLFTWAVNNKAPRSSVADSTRASIGDSSVRDSLNDNSLIRQSVASSALTDSTSTTMLSSLLEVTRSTSTAFNKFGTIRTVTTEATSETPSITRTEGSSLAEDLSRKRGFESKYDLSVVDLSRVIEESEESGTSSRGKGKLREAGKQKSSEEVDKADKVPAIRLGKGKWPDDFLDLPSQVRQKSSSPDSDDPPYSTSPISISPPRKLAIVGAQAPRRPSHRARHSLDAPGLAPKEPPVGRDVSPDSGQNRLMLRRHSTKPLPRNGVLVPRGSSEDPRGSDSSEHLVPFPRTPSGEQPRRSPSPRSESPQNPDRPRLPRGRFQSDIEGSKRRPRPSSYDELGAKPSRSRFESMVNLGVASSNASASDLIHRDSMDGSAVRKTLIIKEEGKPPTHFQLGNCIGRGQFGSVYRALNLNTGQMVAVKRIRLEGLKEEEVTTLMREVDLVKSLSHPSIVKYEGMARDADTLSIVLEYAENGSLGQTLKAFGRLNERLVASYVVKILEGLHYLHQCDVVHCDLKAANILTTKNGNVKLSDFGVSLNMRAVERDIKDVAGTPNWMAPEVIELKGASPKSDIWSLACTVIELLTGKPPYADIANGMSVMFRIVEDDMPPLPEDCSPSLRNFLTQCFNKDPNKRPSAELLCEHDWLKQNWGLHKELRPQDSIPFLRRVSADLQKSDAVRFLASMDIPDSPATDSPRADDAVSGSPPGRRLSNNSLRPPPLNDSEISPREHTFVKTTFSKPMLCRVCLLNVKKSAVLCAQCSLISHAKCAVNAPPTCDLRAQLLLYAQYAQNGNPASAYSNPADQLKDDQHPKSPMSDVSYVAHTPRTSLDIAPPPPPATPAPSSPPPTSFKFMAAFKRSRSPEPGSNTPTEGTRGKVLVRKNRDRPQSLGSNSTNPNSSSVRSTTTDTHSGVEETSSTPRPPKTATSDADAEEDNRSVHWQMPGDLSNQPRHKKSKSSGNCAVQ